MTQERFIGGWQDKLIISKKDEVYAKITCEKHHAQELSEFFTFFVPGYQFVLRCFVIYCGTLKLRLFDLRSNSISL
jgi:hypothetical protein